MTFLISLFVSLAFADTCKFGAVEFDFSADSDMSRSLVIKGTGAAKVALPRVGNSPVNMAQTEEGKGSLCQNSAVFSLGGDKIAVLFETVGTELESTYLSVFDFKTKKFDVKPLQVAHFGQLLSEKTDKGFAFMYTPFFGEEEGLREGVGKAAGMTLTIDKADLWKRVELGAKGMEVKVDRDLTWKNSRWNKYITNRTEFEKAFRMSDFKAAEKVQVFTGFSREQKKDCLMVEYVGERKAFCRPITSAQQ